ncbi:hypothetical protein C8T65DRAFT_669271 [Cerioporus squamosus]|nr:hypothetical protein C8T65DRAFT_669271 [Cerioporus squamosus]
MAASNITIDDTSSLVVYEPADAWAHTSGRDAQPYGNSTYSSSQIEGATAKFLFSGTGFWLYGATKPEYGQYILLVDHQVMLYANATSDEPRFGQVLGGSSGLADGRHEVVLMAAGGGLVDIDAIIGASSSVSPAQTDTQTASTSSSSQTIPRLSATPNGKTDGSKDTASDQASSSSSLSSTAAATAVDGASGQRNAPSTAQSNAQTGDQSSQSNTQTSQQATALPSARPNASAGAAASSGAAESPSQSQSQTATTTANFLSPTISQAQSAGDSRTAACPWAPLSVSQSAQQLGLLLLVALYFIFLRRRRAKARRRADVALPSPVLPLQNPDTQGGYFFGGYSGGQGANPLREMYLSRSPPGMSQARGPSWGVTAGRRSGAELLPASTFRDSAGSYADTSTLVSEGGTDVSLKTGPTRPPRPPELHLDV